MGCELFHKCFASSVQLLGINASKQEIAAMLERAGADEASELNPGAFTRIMTGVLTKSDSTPGTAAAVRMPHDCLL